MFIDNSSSIWKECLNEVPQQSVLDHLQFNIFINDLDEEVDGILIRSVGNTKLMDARLKNWADSNRIKFSRDKYKVLHL